MALDLMDQVATTRLDMLVSWCRKYSLWPMPFATACCGIELMATGASRHDIARFGAEVMRFSPRQCDLMIVAGRIVMKMLPVLQRIWQQMPEPKWCISMGACASTGGVFDTYCVVQGIDRFIPVDVYVPGCPPRPEQLIQSVVDLQEKIQREGTLWGKEFARRAGSRRSGRWKRSRHGYGGRVGQGRGSHGGALQAGKPWRRAVTDANQKTATEAPPGSRLVQSTLQAAIADLRDKVGEAAASEFRGQTRVVVHAAAAHPALARLRDAARLRHAGRPDVRRLLALCRPKDRFGLVYLLANTQTNERITVRAFSTTRSRRSRR